MPHFRATVRYGVERKQYWMHDVTADDAATAMRAVADALPDGINTRTDIIELRLQSDPAKREYIPEG